MPDSDVNDIFRLTQTGPNMQGMPELVRALAPLVASFNNSGYVASAGGGLSPFESQYINEVTTPLAQQSEALMTQSIAKMFSETFAATGGASMTKADNKSLVTVMENFTQDIVDPATMRTLAGSKLAESVYGGNPFDLSDKMFANRNLMGTGSGQDFINPLDIAGQTQMTQRSVDLTQSIMERSRDNTGLPNLDYTRGFSFDQMGDMATFAMQQDPKGAKSMSTDDLSKVVGNYAKSFESIADMIGSDDTGKMFSAMKAIQAGNLPEMTADDVKNITTKFSTMSKMMDTNSEVMFAAGTQVANNLAGVGLGIEGGEAVMRRANAIAGVGADPARVMSIAQGQQDLLAAGMSSQTGKSVQAIEYFNQLGTIDPGAYAQYARAFESGDLGAQREATSTALTNIFGSESRAMESMSNPEFMSMIRSNSGLGARTAAIGRVGDAQTAFLGVQGVASSQGAIGALSQENVDAGGTGLSDERSAWLQLGAAANAITDLDPQDSMGRADNIKRFVRSARREGKSSSETLSGLDNLLSLSQFDDVRDTIASAQKEAVASGQIRTAANADPELVGMTAGISALRKVAPNERRDTQLDAIGAKREQAQAARDRGDDYTADRLEKEAKNDYRAVKDTLPLNLRTLAQNESAIAMGEQGSRNQQMRATQIKMNVDKAAQDSQTLTAVGAEKAEAGALNIMKQVQSGVLKGNVGSGHLSALAKKFGANTPEGERLMQLATDAYNGNDLRGSISLQESVVKEMVIGSGELAGINGADRLRAARGLDDASGTLRAMDDQAFMLDAESRGVNDRDVGNKANFAQTLIKQVQSAVGGQGPQGKEAGKLLKGVLGSLGIKGKDAGMTGALANFDIGTMDVDKGMEVLGSLTDTQMGELSKGDGLEDLMKLNKLSVDQSESIQRDSDRADSGGREITIKGNLKIDKDGNATLWGTGEDG